MKSLNSRVSSVGIFAAGTALLVLYLLSMHYNIYLHLAVFWAAITMMYVSLAYQCLTIRQAPGHAKVVLIEIAIAAVAFHMIYQIPYYGLTSSDAYRNMAPLRSILSSGFVNGDPQYASEEFQFPLLHVFAAQISSISGLDPFVVIKWFPSLIDVAVVPLLFLLLSNLFKDNRTALLSTLLFASLEHHVSFGSVFIKETLGVVLAVCCLYLYFSARSSSNPPAFRTLAIVCLAGAVLAHHLTSFMLLLFLVMHFAVTYVFRRRPARREHSEGVIPGEPVTATFVVLAVVSILTYWTYLVQSPFYNLAGLIGDFLAFNRWGQTITGSVSGVEIVTTRGLIIFYGFYSFMAIFALILWYGLIRRDPDDRPEKYSYTFYLFLCGALGIVSLYLIQAQATPDRFLTFGWLFGFAPLVLAILAEGHQRFTQIGVFLLVAFMFFNIFMIDATAWDRQAEGVAFATSLEDYRLARAIDFSTGNILAHQNEVMAIYDVHNRRATVSFQLPDIIFTEFDWVIAQKEELRIQRKYYPQPRTKEIADIERLESQGDPAFNRVYESNNLAAFRRITN